MQVGMQSGGQGYCSTEEENAAASSGNVALFETLDVTADVPNWSVSVYCTHHGWMLGAFRLLEMFSEG